MVSVICPIYNEEKYIAQCIDSILAQDYPTEDLEILFVDGMSNDRTREIVAQYAQQYNYIRLIDNPEKIVPYAMNRGIEASKGDIIIRLDAHAIYPHNYFSELVKGLNQHQADNVGAQCSTLPADSSAKALAIALALSSPLGVGNSMFRIGVKEDIEADTVPFGCFKRKIFDKVGMYDLDLVRNQDDELNARIIQHGGKIVLLAGITINYYARDTFSKLYRMYYQYGLYKPLVNKKLGSPATIRQLIPPLFVVGIVLGLLLSICLPYLWIAYTAVLGLYLLAGLLQGAQQARHHKKVALLLLLPWAIFTLHTSYGIGYWIGLGKILLHRPFHAQVNR